MYHQEFIIYYELLVSYFSLTTLNSYFIIFIVNNAQKELNWHLYNMFDHFWSAVWYLSFILIWYWFDIFIWYGYDIDDINILLNYKKWQAKITTSANFMKKTSLNYTAWWHPWGYDIV